MLRGFYLDLDVSLGPSFCRDLLHLLLKLLLYNNGPTESLGLIAKVGIRRRSSALSSQVQT